MPAIWEYFKLKDDDRSKAVCKIGTASVSRGGKQSISFNTSNLIKHLKTHHSAKYTEFTNASAKPQQRSLTEVFQKREKLSKDNPRSIKITEALTHFIALDDQPLSVVDNVGFRRLLGVLEPRYDIPSRPYITDVMLPKVYDEVKNHVRSLVHDATAISFTTDIWTSSVCPMSLLSLTAQWIDKVFTVHHITLQVKPFRCSHTSQAIANIFEDMLQIWGIPKSSIHVVLRDNAKNMIKAMADAGLPSLSCAAHTL
ncbi:hypothetical protein QQF64_022382 [Cirrhinus molitorella]|uniref:BED-type domain-containing protein n=1 Tax=Cirrhinus molitorella TaxID=172907 RepID=A0ABR3L804_9TELE